MTVPGDKNSHMKKVYTCFQLLIVIIMTGMAEPAFNQNASPQRADSVLPDYTLPFLETWDGGSLGFQQWTGEGNWICKTSAGDPAPSADFTRQPVMTGYSTSLISAEIDASGWTCASIWLDFDYKLEDVTASGTEQLYVEVMWDSVWHPVAEFVNNGSTGWISSHLDISQTIGKTLRVRFRANGTTTANILNWYIDNISVYGVGDPPEGLNDWQSNNSVHLTWSPPPCFQAGQTICFIFDDGNLENGMNILPGWSEWLGNLFPISGSISGTLQSFSILWYNNPAATDQPFQIDVYSQAGVYLGSSQTFTVPIPAPSTFMTIPLENGIPFSGPFYGMIHWNNFTGPTHWLGSDSDGPYSYLCLYYYFDGTTFTPIVAICACGCKNFTERACGVLSDGKTRVTLGPAPLTDVKQDHEIDQRILSQASLETFNPQGRVTMNMERTMDADSSLAGYNVYRYDSVPTGVIPFRKINQNTITDLSYTDLLDQDTLQYGFYRYYITAVVNDPATGQFLYESAATDSINIQFPNVGIAAVSPGSVAIFPNPANDVVNVQSNFPISRIEVINYTGQTVYAKCYANTKLARISTSLLKSGIYVVKVITPKGTLTSRIIIIR
jgi:hypothetical protein